ncbi:MAG: hypothetical protein VYA17_02725 [Pseudomonadota bacterium]|nr:hypothetical protein [Pseudomonadota bacterium]
MAEHSNVVRRIVDENKQNTFINAFGHLPDCNRLLSHILIQRGENTFGSCGVRKDMDAMDGTMPERASLLNASRHLLVEILPEAEVTDPVSGAVVFEKKPVGPAHTGGFCGRAYCNSQKVSPKTHDPHPYPSGSRQSTGQVPQPVIHNI